MSLRQQRVGSSPPDRSLKRMAARIEGTGHLPRGLKMRDLCARLIHRWGGAGIMRAMSKAAPGGMFEHLRRRTRAVRPPLIVRGRIGPFVLNRGARRDVERRTFDFKCPGAAPSTTSGVVVDNTSPTPSPFRRGSNGNFAPPRLWAEPPLSPLRHGEGSCIGRAHGYERGRGIEAVTA